MVQQNNDDCDVPVIGEHKADNGESKNDVTVLEMAQQNVDILGLDIQISDDEQRLMLLCWVWLNKRQKTWRLKFLTQSWELFL